MLRKSFAAAAAAACVAWLGACQTIKVESFDREMSPDLVTAYQEAPAIVDQQRIASDFWRIYDGKVVMTKQGFSARRSYEMLPLGLQGDFRAADYNAKGSLLSNRSSQSLLWGLAYWTQGKKMYDEQGTKRIDNDVFGLAGGLAYLHYNRELYTAAGGLKRRKEMTGLLATVLQESQESAMTDAGRRTDHKIQFCWGLLGWRRQMTGANSLYFLFIPIPLGGADVEKVTISE